MQSPSRSHPLANRTVPTGPHRLMGGTLTAGPVRISIVAAALLFVSSLWTPDPHNTPTVCSWYHREALEGGRGRESGPTSGMAANPREGGDSSRNCLMAGSRTTSPRTRLGWKVPHSNVRAQDGNDGGVG